MPHITNEEALEWARTAKLPFYVGTQSAGFGKGVSLMTLIKHIKRHCDHPFPELSEEGKQALRDQIRSAQEHYDSTTPPSEDTHDNPT